MTTDENTLDFSLVLASSVHDMKNSVGMLLSSLEEVINVTPVEDEHQRQRLGVLQYEAQRINSELIQLLSIYRMQNNRMPLHIDEHFVIDIFEEQLARNDMLLLTRNVTAELDCDPDLNWYFDSDLIGGVVHNVLVNCVRYTRSRLTLSAQLQDQELCITIADDGNGYPQAMLEGLGVVVDESIAENSTHLGLFFAAQVAALHSRDGVGGRIELANGGVLGGGIFKLYLP